MTVNLHNHGSIWLVEAMDPESLNWLEVNTDPDATWWTNCSLAVEPRYLGALVIGMENAGIQVDSAN